MSGIITNRNGQLVSCDGYDAVEAFRLRTLIVGVKAEGLGIKVRRGQSCLSIAKETTGLRTNNRDKQIVRLREMLQTQLAKVEVVNE
jgi:hypothetical protein